MVIAIVDKTVLTDKGQEHISLHWILNHEKFTKSKNKLYDPAKDYFGFFPLKNQEFELRGLERFDTTELNRLSDEAALTYFTDTYGIYRNEWYNKGDVKDRSGIVYGGMSKEDFYFLKKMYDKKKLIITEFNTIGSPTDPAIRKNFEDLFGIQWTGWIGRFFEILDTTVNKEIPSWLIESYKRQHKQTWPFKKSGIAFIHADRDEVVILEKDRDLQNELPYIYSTPDAKSAYHLPDSIKYTFWFDIMYPDSNKNRILASYRLHTTANGQQLLHHAGIPSFFPAIICSKDINHPFFYFSGDFADNPVTYTTSYFKGIRFFKWLMYTSREPLERKSFFWRFYQPLVTTVLNDYYEKLNQ